MSEPSWQSPHRRYNPLLDEWVLVSAGRTSRPWQGATETLPPPGRPAYDPGCYLCPGNDRAGGARNPDYAGTFVFTNDYAALRPGEWEGTYQRGLIEAAGVEGTCRVLCYSPRHDLTMAQMSQPEVRAVVDLWADQVIELSERFSWVQVFENRGEAMGASNPHPHGQIWASSIVPSFAAREDRTQRNHHAAAGSPLLGDYRQEEMAGPRIVLATGEWTVLTPFWAVWPFETLLIPNSSKAAVPLLDDAQRQGLAGVLIDLLARYDALFDHPMPYSMGWHGAPGAVDDPAWTVHAHFYPPLLRSATVRKWMVGYEMLAEPQRDITAEEAADRLRRAGAA